MVPILDFLPSDTPERLQAGIELVPIPAAHLLRAAEGWQVELVNHAFRRSGLGMTAGRSPMIAALADRLDAFVASDACNLEFDWVLGEGVDGRHYRVSMARMSAQVRHRCAIGFVDYTAQVATERTLRREMTTDSLTGLPNRTGFGNLVEAATLDQGSRAVLVVDLDRFGQLNACLGSVAGDELLMAVARRLREALCPGATLARIGGDEFGVLLQLDGDVREAGVLADRMARALQAPFRLADLEIGIECSIGIALGGAEPGDAEELIRHAQFAVKRAAASGRTETYHPQDLSAARAQFPIETQLRRAIEERQLRLTFHPICNIATGRVVAFEALARWTDRQGVDRSPADFIPVAEESGLIVPLGRWAIEEAARTLAGWDRAAGGHSGVNLAVNLSPIQLQRDSIAPVVEAALAASGLPGHRLTLELTESAIVGDPDRVAGVMHALKALGTRLALDDFGTGYSNLAYLHRLPIDILKIDKSFVTGMMADRDKIAIVRAVLSLAQALGKQTTAEGVETEALAQTLAALGCTYGQGYLYARPLEAADAWSLIAPATTASAIASTRG